MRELGLGLGLVRLMPRWELVKKHEVRELGLGLVRLIPRWQQVKKRQVRELGL